MLSQSAFQGTPRDSEVPFQLKVHWMMNLRFGNKQALSNWLNMWVCPAVNTIYSMYLFVQGKYLTLDSGPCNIFGYLHECEMEFYNYLKINLESENELEQ